MDPNLAIAGITLLNILLEKGPDAYFKIVNAMQVIDPTLRDFEKLLAVAKDPDSF